MFPGLTTRHKTSLDAAMRDRFSPLERGVIAVSLSSSLPPFVPVLSHTQSDGGGRGHANHLSADQGGRHARLRPSTGQSRSLCRRVRAPSSSHPHRPLGPTPQPPPARAPLRPHDHVLLTVNNAPRLPWEAHSLKSAEAIQEQTQTTAADPYTNRTQPVITSSPRRTSHTHPPRRTPYPLPKTLTSASASLPRRMAAPPPAEAAAQPRGLFDGLGEMLAAGTKNLAASVDQLREPKAFKRQDDAIFEDRDNAPAGQYQVCTLRTAPAGMRRVETNNILARRHIPSAHGGVGARLVGACGSVVVCQPIIWWPETRDQRRGCARQADGVGDQRAEETETRKLPCCCSARAFRRGGLREPIPKHYPTLLPQGGMAFLFFFCVCGPSPAVACRRLPSPPPDSHRFRVLPRRTDNRECTGGA